MVDVKWQFMGSWQDEGVKSKAAAAIVLGGESEE